MAFENPTQIEIHTYDCIQSLIKIVRDQIDSLPDVVEDETLRAKVKEELRIVRNELRKLIDED